MFKRATGIISIIFILNLFLALNCMAQERWEWPEHPINILALPSDITPTELRSAMHEFSQGLGVRCNYCHVGEEGQPFTKWDFAADDKPNKERAREMIRMIGDIDEHLAKIKPSGDKRVYMSCYTCHRGRPRPMTLEEEIRETYRKEGLEPAIMHLSKLKEEFYGKGMYNFESPEPLNSLGYSLLDSNDTSGAVRVFKLNAEKFPKAGEVWMGLADANVKSGNTVEAIEDYKKSLELNPRNRRAKEMLDKLGNDK